MNAFVWALIVGVVVMAVGLGLVTDVKIKDLEAKLSSGKKGAGTFLLFVGFVPFVVGILGIAGVIPDSGTTSPQGEGTPSASPSPATALTSSASTTSSSHSSSPPSNPASEFKVILDQPTPGMLVPLEGTPVSGHVEGDLGGGTLWLVTLSDGLWYLDQQIGVGADRRFNIESGQIGEATEHGKDFELEVIRAKPDQSQAIATSTPNSEGDVVFSAQPGDMAASVTVRRK